MYRKLLSIVKLLCEENIGQTWACMLYVDRWIQLLEQKRRLICDEIKIPLLLIPSIKAKSCDSHLFIFACGCCDTFLLIKFVSSSTLSLHLENHPFVDALTYVWHFLSFCCLFL